MLKPLPASTQTFRKIREGGYLYVDKTQYLYKLVRDPIGVYFLSRPRRFGKSLTVSTLEEIFQGNQEIFEGLWIDGSDYAWQPHPVIRFDFSANPVKNTQDLTQVMDDELQRIAHEHKLSSPLQGFNHHGRFQDLIRQVAQKSQVAILIDEYDKPILDNIEHLEEAERIRDTLKDFYTVMKAMDQYIHFIFITGISKFSRVGVFSTLNHLEDLTMDPAFATALGITETELRESFESHIATFAKQEGNSSEELLGKIQDWYNGFRFTERDEAVYNPYSTIQLFKKQRFGNYWFETGTPSFLMRLIKDRWHDVQEFSGLEASEIDFNTYDLEDLEIVPLLFQRGYLTVKDAWFEEDGWFYLLGYPNREVENAFRAYLLRTFSSVERTLSRGFLRKLTRALKANDLDLFFTTLDGFFARIPYDLHLKQERYYHTILYLLFLLLGVDFNSATSCCNKPISQRLATVDRWNSCPHSNNCTINCSCEIAPRTYSLTKSGHSYRLMVHNSFRKGIGDMGQGIGNRVTDSPIPNPYSRIPKK